VAPVNLLNIFMIIDADAHFTQYLTADTSSPEANAWISDYMIRKTGRFSDVAQRKEEMRMLGVDRQLLNPMGKSLQLFYNMDRSIAPYVMRKWNDTISEIVENNDCFDMNIWLALQDVDASLAEIDRMLEKKFFGIHVSESPHWGLIKEFDPIFAKISQHQIPWYIHLTFVNDNVEYEQTVPAEFANLKKKWVRNFWMFSLATLILGGTLDRYPDLKIVVVERDFDWVDAFRQGFVEEGFDDPLLYIKRNFWFTIEPEREDFVATAEKLGYDRLLFATDWPHDDDAGGANSRQDVETINSLAISLHDRQRICSKNYMSLCR
jgi:predicted TIM-barrel fold metal-dependent hydrolase